LLEIRFIPKKMATTRAVREMYGKGLATWGGVHVEMDLMAPFRKKEECGN